MDPRPSVFMAGYDEFATPRQQEIIDAAREHGTVHAAFKAGALTGVETAAYAAIRRLKKTASRRGFAPDHDQTHAAPVGQRTRGTSTLYDNDGNVRLQWVKTAFDSEQYEDVLEALEVEIKDRVPPCQKIPAPRGKFEQDCAVVYPMGDPHIGMYAWAEECGEDFDTDIAVRDLLAVFDRLLAGTPKTEQAVILNLGDFFHADNAASMTSRSGHHLDTDTRWAKVLSVGTQLMFDMVARALVKHKHVTVRNCIGNHDDHSSIALTYALDAYYHANPRVTIEKSPSMFWYWRFGETLVGATHGDKTKLKDLPLVMASDRAKDWGETENRYWYTGHVHHRSVLEEGGVICESFRTLAAKDSYHAGQRYRSGRDMHAIVLHKRYGEVDRLRCDLRWARDNMKDG